MKTFCYLLLTFGLWGFLCFPTNSWASSGRQLLIKRSQMVQEEVQDLESITDPEAQDKKKAKQNTENKEAEVKNDSSMLDTVKEMFHNAFDFFYSPDEKKVEQHEEKKK